MEELIATPHEQAPVLFNSVVETGLRIVMVLDALIEHPVDLNTVCLLDHYVVHTADIGGPESLHPATSARAGEYLVRRRLVEQAMDLMRRRRLVLVVHDGTGNGFLCSQDAAAVVDLMKTSYNTELRKRAFWLADRLSDEGAGFVDRMRSGIAELSAAEVGNAYGIEVR